jgi:FMN phosphatase YigB (HAD superfamily)
MQALRWLFFDLGNTLIDEGQAWEARLRLLVEALERHGRRRSLEEARAALAAAAADFAPRFIAGAVEKLIDDEECRRSVLPAARYRKELEVPYAAAEPVLRALSATHKLGVIANQSAGATQRLTRCGLMPGCARAPQRRLSPSPVASAAGRRDDGAIPDFISKGVARWPTKA